MNTPEIKLLGAKVRPSTLTFRQNCYLHDSFRLGVRQRTKQYTINYAKHCRVHPDAEGKCYNRHSGEARVFRHHALAEADILNEHIQEPHAPSVAAFFLYLINATELSQRRETSLFRAHPRRHV